MDAGISALLRREALESLSLFDDDFGSLSLLADDFGSLSLLADKFESLFVSGDVFVGCLKRGSTSSSTLHGILTISSCRPVVPAVYM